MIEMRWLVKKWESHEDGMIVDKYSEPVLQYREMTVKHNENGLIDSVYEWSEWQDVPTVTVEE